MLNNQGPVFGFCGWWVPIEVIHNAVHKLFFFFNAFIVPSLKKNFIEI